MKTKPSEDQHEEKHHKAAFGSIVQHLSHTGQYDGDEENEVGIIGPLLRGAGALSIHEFHASIVGSSANELPRSIVEAD
jgi:hypothetical protein